MAHGKKYIEAAKLVEHGRVYEPGEAVELVKQTTTVSFDATVEAHLRLGVDPRHADQLVRGTVVLPHGTGKVVRVAVFATGEKAQEALRAGADEVGGDDLVKKIEAGWLEFDVALATPDSMGLVGKLGKILGRRGLMPNPKAGTITFDLERAIKEVKAGRVEYKVDKAGIVHVAVGKQQLRGERAAREPRDPRRRGQPRQAVGRQGPVPQDPHDRQHDGPGHPGRPAGRPGRGRGLTPGRRDAGRPDAMTAERPVKDQCIRRQTDGPPQTACARGPPTTRTGVDGRSLIRRTGPRPSRRGGDRGRRRARRGRSVPHTLRVGCAPASRDEPRVEVVRAVAGATRPTRSGVHRRTPAACRTKEGHMPTEAKQATVAELREDLANSRTLIVSEYRGLKVKEIAEIRRALRKQDVSYRVVKNRLMRIAAEDSVGEALSPLLTGPTAIAFGNDEAGTAKAVLDATRPYNKIVRITGGVLGDKAIDADAVTRLAALPSREVLLAKLAGGMQAPVSTLAGLFAAPLRNLGYALAQVAEQKAKADGA